MEKVIEVKNLKRTYKTKTGFLHKKVKDVEALKGVTFDVYKGEIFGILGPNGAGKTTTIKILTTLLAPTSGDVKVLGCKPFGEEKKLRPRINFIFGGERSLYWRLTARENLMYFSDLYKIDEKKQKSIVDNLLMTMGLKDRSDYKVETFSKGMKERLQIARGLLNDPEILFLDEPTIGLDPVGAMELRNIIRKLSKEDGRTIILTTHYMEEAEELCDRIAIINSGKVIALDETERLKNMVDKRSKIKIVYKDIEDNCLKKLESLNDIENIKVYEDKKIIELMTYKPEIAAQETFSIFGTQNIKGFEVKKPSLEDVYIKLVGDSNEC